MDQQQKQTPRETPKEPGYVPRPAWQVWAARIGLAVFVIFLVLYYLNIFRGGLL